ncbi:MAG: DUF3592 domain-containing protein [Phototrophicaceae bacterium]
MTVSAKAPRRPNLLLIFFGVLLFFLGFQLAGASYQVGQLWYLQQNGIRTQGEIVGRSQVDDTYRLLYQFTDSNGRTIAREQIVPEEIYQEYIEGSEVLVSFLPQDSSQNQLYLIDFSFPAPLLIVSVAAFGLGALALWRGWGDFALLMAGLGNAATKANADQVGLYFYVRPRGCEEVVAVRIDTHNDLSLGDDGEYFVNKTVRGSHRCFNPADLELRFNTGRQLVSSGVQGGELVDEATYAAWQAKIAPKE